MIDFSLTPELEALKTRTESFVRDVVIPLRGETRARAGTASTTRSGAS